MLKIIDATLCALNGDKINKADVLRLIELMKNISVTHLQITPRIYDILEGELPKDVVYYMDLDISTYIAKDYAIDNNIQYYFVPKQKNNDMEIPVFQINSIKEPYVIDKGWDIIKVIGLDDMLIGGVDNAFAFFSRLFPIKKILICPENTYSCATAIAITFLKRKGLGAISTFWGIGNKAATEQILMAFHITDRYLPNRNFKEFIELKALVEKMSDVEIPPFAPIVGEKIFHVESGIHVAGILKKSSNYELYPPEIVGNERKIVLGKHTGKTAVAEKIKELDSREYTDEEIETILNIVKRVSIAKGYGISDDEFLKILNEVWL